MVIGFRAICIRRVCALLVALTGFLVGSAASGQDAANRQLVSLELALLVDVSASFNKEGYRLQLDGLSAAFTSPTVLAAIRQSDGIAVAVIPWAHQAYQYVGVEWTVLYDEEDAQGFASRVLTMPRRVPSGQTAIGNALAFAFGELENNAFVGERQVIDLSGDGRANDGRTLGEHAGKFSTTVSRSMPWQSSMKCRISRNTFSRS